MTQVSTRLEVFGATSVALTRCSTRIAPALAAGVTEAERAERRGFDTLRERQAALRAAEEALRHASEEEAAALAAVVARCAELVHVAQAVVRDIQALLDSLRREGRVLLLRAEECAQEGQRALRAWEQGLEQYLAGGGGGGGGGGGADGPAASGSAGGPSGLSDQVSAQGLTMLPVASATFDDNPILSWPHGVNEADVTWAVERWDTVVSKVVARGGSIDELRARDQKEGTVGSLRQLSRVHEMFLSGDAITVSPRGDGTYDVHDGRHRVYVAKKLGVTSLPVRVLGGPA